MKKVAGGTTTRYIYSGTKVIAEYVGSSLSKEYIYSGSGLLATLDSGGTPTYHHTDHLSVRVNSNSSGTTVGEQGHYPFGESWYSSSTTTKWSFTTYERDSESGLDYAMFRYDSSRLGRFMTPDPISGSIGNPQSLNRYAYTRNDPVNLADPLGLFYTSWVWGGGGGGIPWIFIDRIDYGGFSFYGPTGLVGSGGENSGAGGSRFELDFALGGGEPGDGELSPRATGRTLDRAARTMLTNRLKGFEKTNCAKVFAQGIPGFSVAGLRKKAKNVQFFNARHVPDRGLTQDQAVGNGVTTNLNQTVAENVTAVTINGPLGSAVILGPNFFSNPGIQPNVLLHELLHVSPGLSDNQIFGAFKNHGLKRFDQRGTGDISDWIGTDCRRTPGTF